MDIKYGGIPAFVDIDTDRLRAMSPPEGPVVMLNLYRFKSAEAGDRFRQSMMPIMGPVLDKLGAEILYSGIVSGEFVANEQWDTIALVRYPDFQSFIDFFANGEAGNKVEQLRRACLEASRIIVTSR